MISVRKDRQEGKRELQMQDQVAQNVGLAKILLASGNLEEFREGMTVIRIESGGGDHSCMQRPVRRERIGLSIVHV